MSVFIFWCTLHIKVEKRIQTITKHITFLVLRIHIHMTLSQGCFKMMVLFLWVKIHFSQSLAKILEAFSHCTQWSLSKQQPGWRPSWSIIFTFWNNALCIVYFGNFTWRFVATVDIYISQTGLNLLLRKQPGLNTPLRDVDLYCRRYYVRVNSQEELSHKALQRDRQNCEQNWKYQLQKNSCVGKS